MFSTIEKLRSISLSLHISNDVEMVFGDDKRDNLTNILASEGYGIYLPLYSGATFWDRLVVFAFDRKSLVS